MAPNYMTPKSHQGWGEWLRQHQVIRDPSEPYAKADGKWHSDYMAKVKMMTTDSLQYVIKDCRDAIEAMPENPKCQQYMDEIHYCATELRIRDEAAAPHDDAVKAQMRLHAAICDKPTHRHIAAAQDQFDIAEQAYDVADYARCSDACRVGLAVLGVK